MHTTIVNHHIKLVYLFYIERSVMQKCDFLLNNGGQKNNHWKTFHSNQGLYVIPCYLIRLWKLHLTVLLEEHDGSIYVSVRDWK